MKIIWAAWSKDTPPKRLRCHGSGGGGLWVGDLGCWNAAAGYLPTEE